MCCHNDISSIDNTVSCDFQGEVVLFLYVNKEHRLRPRSLLQLGPAYTCLHIQFRYNDLTSDINKGAQRSPGFTWSVCVMERAGVPNVSYTQCIVCLSDYYLCFQLGTAFTLLDSLFNTINSKKEKDIFYGLIFFTTSNPRGDFSFSVNSFT
jgi:hypothetical protein